MPTTAIIDIGPSCSSTPPTSRRRTRSRRSGRPTCTPRLAASPGFVDFVRARAEALRHPHLVRRARGGRHPGLRGHGDPALRPAGRRARRPAPATAPGRLDRCTSDATRSRSRRWRSSWACSSSSSCGPRPSGAAFAGLSSQDLTVLVANLNDRNDQLRREIATLERELATLQPERGSAATPRSTSCAPTCAASALYAGLDAGDRAGRDHHGPRPDRRHRRRGPDQRAAQRRRRGDRHRRRPPRAGRRRSAAPGRGDGRRAPLGDPFELVAIGAAGQADRLPDPVGGIIAQLAATQPEVVVEVTPVDRVDVPATDRDLVPADGQPRL